MKLRTGYVLIPMKGRHQTRPRSARPPKGFNLVAQSNQSKSSSSKRRMLDFIDAGVLPRDEEETSSET